MGGYWIRQVDAPDLSHSFFLDSDRVLKSAQGPDFDRFGSLWGSRFQHCPSNFAPNLEEHDPPHPTIPCPLSRHSGPAFDRLGNRMLDQARCGTSTFG